MTYTDLLNIAGTMLSLDGWVLAAYMFLAALIAAAMGLKAKSGEFFFLWFLGLILAFLGPAYADTVIQARFPYVFIFCFGIVGVGLAFLGFIAICFAPSIFAFMFKTTGRRLLLVANLAMVFPFGPVILFYFALRDYKKALATIPGASPDQPSVITSAAPSQTPAATSNPEVTIESDSAAISGENPELSVATDKNSLSQKPETVVESGASEDLKTAVESGDSQDPKIAVESTDSTDPETAGESGVQKTESADS